MTNMSLSRRPFPSLRFLPTRALGVAGFVGAAQEWQSGSMGGLPLVDNTDSYI